MTVAVDSAFWHHSAACRTGGADIWFDSEQVDLAKKVCATCPAWEHCGRAAAAAGDAFGVRAGFDLSVPAEREELRELMGHPKRGHAASSPCGKCGQQFENRSSMRWCPNCRDLVDAQPVREHVERLRAALTLIQIAGLGGMTVPALRHLLYAKDGGCPPVYTGRKNAAFLLAIPVPERAVS